MPSNADAPGVSRAGFGKQGYCKLCAFQGLAELNKAIENKWNAAQINAWLKAKHGFTVNRQTIYTHKAHSKDPADRVVTAVEKARLNGAVLPRQSTPTQFLEAVRDLAYQRAIDHPEEVTIDHGIKAAQVLATSKNRGGDTILILARVMTGGEAGVPIEGEYTEVKQLAP